jgi:hypothetical protein
MKKSRWIEPYTPQGKTNFRWTYGKTGAYLIKSKKTNKILYVGYSGYNLYRTLYRHFQSWDDPSQHRATYGKNSTKVQIILSPASQAHRLEMELVKKYNPRDVQYKYKGQTKRDVTINKKYKEAKNIPF